MKIREFHVGQQDFEMAEEWLKRRGVLVSEGSSEVDWKDRVIASVVGMAEKVKTRRRKE